MNPRLAAAILLLGALGIGLTAVYLRDSAADALILAAEAGGTSLGVGILVAALLWALRRKSITTQLQCRGKNDQRRARFVWA